ncbi:hypothetical protein ACJOV8_002030 [Formosa sp. 3Alg 14/1]|uniref:hypothetical protein n=1 Tax=unclassified Formosa TaxID=2644710 RepID=UPI0039BE651A
MAKVKSQHLFIQFFKIFSLGILLLLSPCSVRTSLQSILQLEQTEVTSKSKIAQLNRSCETPETSQLNTSDYNNAQGKIAGLLPLKSKYAVAESIADLKQPILFWAQSKQVRPLKIPLYILYKNKKDVILT